MLNSGYISFISETGGGFTSTGDPLPSVKTESAFITCNLNVLTREYKVLIDGTYTNAKYSIYLDQVLFEPLELDLQTIQQVTLQDSNQNSLGTYRIQSREYLNLTKRIKIIL